MNNTSSTSCRRDATQPVVQIDSLTKSYGDHRVVDELSMSVRQGEIFGVLGHNGAGKTTAVECAQGIRQADSGQVRVFGFDPIADRGRLRGRVGSQLQNSNLPDRLKVQEALRLFADSADQAEHAMSQWELAPIAATAFGDLSGGQRQRLFLALALINEPELVFLDELTQGLDPTARRLVWDLIEQVRDQGTTVVLVTHFMEEAEVLCDRVVMMADGRAVATGTPAELIDKHGHGVRVRFTGDLTDLDWLRSIPGATGASVQRHEVEVAGPSPVIVHIGAELAARSRFPDTFRVQNPDLEDAFRAVINEQGAVQ